jgi:hypothetical protein
MHDASVDDLIIPDAEHKTHCADICPYPACVQKQARILVEPESDVEEVGHATQLKVVFDSAFL